MCASQVCWMLRAIFRRYDNILRTFCYKPAGNHMVQQQNKTDNIKMHYPTIDLCVVIYLIIRCIFRRRTDWCFPLWRLSCCTRTASGSATVNALFSRISRWHKKPLVDETVTNTFPRSRGRATVIDSPKKKKVATIWLLMQSGRSASISKLPN